MVAILKQPPQDPQYRRGWVSTFYRTHNGKRLGPYFVRRWKVGKRVHKEYIKPHEVERVRAMCQAHRDKRSGQQELNAWFTNTTRNLDYLVRMGKRSLQGKLRQVDIDFIDRIEQEGFAITGRPPLRRKVTRAIVQVAGETMLVTTILELNGATRTFMVPLVANRYQNNDQESYRSIRDIVLDAIHRAAGWGTA